jgi:hypothetical protein
VPKRISDRCFPIGDKSLRSLDTTRIARAGRSTGMGRSTSLRLARVVCGAFLLSLLAT